MAKVRAAGGVLWRRAPGAAALGATIEVALVHRPRYDDWSFPKGKHEAGEDDETCARREVEEETGLRVVLGPELPMLEYVDHRGRDKTVAYFAMTMADPDAGFVQNDEVDDMRWCTPFDAEALLTYDLDRHLLRELPFVLSTAGVASLT
jgi:8-oxo-dGTP pyrophosphatase MutT (NUDIX family)